MGLLDKDKTVELIILGPHGKPYVELENEFTEPFYEEGFNFLVPRLYGAHAETTVFITIGIGVITSVSTHLLISLIDKIFKIKKENERKNASVTFNIHVGDNYIKLPGNKDKLLKELERIKKEGNQE